MERIDRTGRKIVLAMRTTAPEKSSNKSTRTSPRGKNELGAAKSGKEKACCLANCWKMFSVLERGSAFITRNKAAVAFSK